MVVRNTSVESGEGVGEAGATERKRIMYLNMPNTKLGIAHWQELSTRCDVSRNCFHLLRFTRKMLPVGSISIISSVATRKCKSETKSDGHQCFHLVYFCSLLGSPFV